MTTVPPSLRAQLPATRLPAVSIVWKGSETYKNKEEEKPQLIDHKFYIQQESRAIKKESKNLLSSRFAEQYEKLILSHKS